MSKKKEVFKRNKVDCSQVKDQNPTRLLEEAEPEIKKITTLEEFKSRMTGIIDSSSISKKNRLKYIEARDRIQTLEEMQMYFYNFILAGSAMQTRFER
jgi:hypothetical protein